MKSKRLEDFIKNYLNNKSISESEDGYRSWLGKNGADTTIALAKNLGAADTEYKMARPTYGSGGERLSTLGLTKSGYAAYLGESRDRTLDGRIKEADEGFASAEKKNRSGYSAFLKEEESKAKKSLNEAKSLLMNSGSTDYDAVYKSATDMGLSESEAELIAKSSTEKAIREARLKVISAIVNKRFGGKQAKEYAEALGLSAELAEELYELAESTNREIDLTKTEGYLDYLRSLAVGNDTTE